MSDLTQIPTNGNTNQLSGIAQLLQQFSSMAGSGTTTTKTSGDPANNDAINQLLQSITSGASDDTMNGIIANIFNQGKQQIGANLFSGAGGGAYNSTTTQQLSGEALSKSVAAASAAKLQAQQQSQETAAKLLQAQSAANRTTTAQTGASPLGKALGPALTALSLYSKATGKGSNILTDGFSGLKNKLFGPKDLGAGDEGLPTITDTTGNGFDPGFDAFGDPTSGVGGGSGGGGGQGGSISDLSSTETSSGELFDTGGGLSTTGADLGSGALESTVDSSAAAGEDVGFDAFGNSTATDAVGSEVGADVAGEAAGEEVGGELAADAVGDVAAEEGGLELADVAISAAAAICRESVRQGLMDPKLYAQEIIKTSHKLSKTTIRGYHYLAIPWVLKMRKDKELSIRLANWAKAYADFIVYDVNSPKAVILRYFGFPICFFIGLCVDEPDHNRIENLEGVI